MTIRKKYATRIYCLVLTLAMIAPRLNGLGMMEVKAEETQPEITQTIRTMNLNTSYLAPSNGKWDTNDHKVYFGQYDGQPTAFRVLRISDGKMLLDCDTTLNDMALNNEPAEWKLTDGRNWLNGDKYYNNLSVFSELEKNAVVQTKLVQEELYEVSNSAAALSFHDFDSNDHVFLLSAREVMYLYENDVDRMKFIASEPTAQWWLRSSVDNNTAYAYVGTHWDTFHKGDILACHIAVGGVSWIKPSSKY